MNLGIILTPDDRSKAYLQKIIKNKIIINKFLFMNDKKLEPKYKDSMIDESIKAGFNISKSVIETLNENKINYLEFDQVDINNDKLIKKLSEYKNYTFIFTGGGILRKNVLNCGPKFLHLHPGIVPDYRGSTCFYYSIIKEGISGVTAYFMDEKLDTGDIIYQKKFPKPNHEFIDEVYDAYIRSETLIYVLKENMLQNKNTIKQNPKEGESYHIIHPVLKHIAILNCIQSND